MVYLDSDEAAMVPQPILGRYAHAITVRLMRYAARGQSRLLIRRDGCVLRGGLQHDILFAQ